MSYCKHCGKELSKTERLHNCTKKGLLDTITDPSFIVETIIDSTIPGGSLGLGLGLGILSSVANAILPDDDDDDDDDGFFSDLFD